MRTVLAINARATALGTTLVADVLVETEQSDAVTVSSIPLALAVAPPLWRFMLDLTPQGIRQLLLVWSTTFQVPSYENVPNKLWAIALKSADISQQPNFMQVRSRVHLKLAEQSFFTDDQRKWIQGLQPKLLLSGMQPKTCDHTMKYKVSEATTEQKSWMFS